MKRRLAALETAPRANMTSVRNGYTQWYVGDTEVLPVLQIGMDHEENDVAVLINTAEASPAGYFGSQSAGGGVVVGLISSSSLLQVMNLAGGGFRVTSAVGEVDVWLSPNASNGALLDVTSNEMYAPLLATAWQADPFVTRDGFGRPRSDSGTYTTVWRTWLPVTADTVASQIYVDLDVGVTSVDVRISARIANTADAFTTVATYAGLTADGYVTSPIWTVPTSISGDGVVIGRMLEFIIETRVTGGAGFSQIGAWAPLANWPS